MKLVLALSVCYGLVFHYTHSAFLKKNEASDFLAVVGKKHGGNGPCSPETCDVDSSDAIEERNLRVRSGRRMDSSSSESAMVKQDVLLPPTAPVGVTK